MQGKPDRRSLRIVYAGSGPFGLKCLDALFESRHELALIVTAPPRPAGRGRKPRPTAVRRWAGDHGIGAVETEDINSPEMVAKIRGTGPDVLVVVAFASRISSELIGVPALAAVNVHASLLPKYRGAAPVNWAIIKGERRTGVTVITLADRMDAGRIVGSVATEIGDEETAGGLHDRLSELAGPLLADVLEKIGSGEAEYVEQDHSGATFAPRLTKADGFVDFGEPAQSVRDRIRGLWPWPGAAAVYLSGESGRRQAVTIAMAQVVAGPAGAGVPAGTVDDNLCVVCGRGALKITRIKPAGRRLMDFGSFVNGWHCRAGDMFLGVA
jgi:methionyl-tRNA formyltransferase